jgi:hypothetical protein
MFGMATRMRDPTNHRNPKAGSAEASPSRSDCRIHDNRILSTELSPVGTKRREKPKKPHPFTQIPEFDKATRKLVRVPKEAVERAEQKEARNGKDRR